MQFHDKEGVIPHDAPTKVFLQAQTVTLFLDTQKNSVWGESTTMETTDLNHGNPVSAAARRFLHLRSYQADPDTNIYSYFFT